MLSISPINRPTNESIATPPAFLRDFLASEVPEPAAFTSSPIRSGESAIIAAIISKRDIDPFSGVACLANRFFLQKIVCAERDK